MHGLAIYLLIKFYFPFFMRFHPGFFRPKMVLTIVLSIVKFNRPCLVNADVVFRWKGFVFG